MRQVIRIEVWDERLGDALHVYMGDALYTEKDHGVLTVFDMSDDEDEIELGCHAAGCWSRVKLVRDGPAYEPIGQDDLPQCPEHDAEFTAPVEDVLALAGERAPFAGTESD